MTRSLGELARRPSGAPSRRPSCRQEPRDLGQIWQAVRLPQGHCLVTFPKQLRRNLRINVNQSTLGHEEANNLRVMLLGMADDPHVVLIKLADRLHNMRTIYAMPLGKAQAAAQETLVIWCSIASRVGLWALKAELEDLCFAVLQGVL